jgi:hypothetical protein
MKNGVFIAIIIGGLAFVWAGAARAHGTGELEIFSFLLDEEGFFQLAAGLTGSIFALFGLYTAWQGNNIWTGMAESEATPDTTRARMMAPGLLIVALGSAVIFATIFILPDKVDVGGHHLDFGARMPKNK